MPSDALIAKIQAIMDRSVERAGPVQKGVVSNPRWKADAARFLERWEAMHAAVITTVGPQGQPHSALVERVAFQEDGTLLMKMYAASVRRRDLQQNNRIAIVKGADNGTALTVYGRAHEVPGSIQESFGGETVDVVVTPSSIYAIIPPTPLS